MTFSVIDVETTGLSPARGDRVVEIGIVRLTDDGILTDVLDTMVNPGRTVRATHIHGITDAMVSDAPAFETLLPRIREILDGTVVCAHNVSFDLGFLREEFRRSGSRFPTLTPVCTLVLARRYFAALPSRSLESCRRHLNLPENLAHSALGDARTAAGLLKYMLNTYQPVLKVRVFRSRHLPRSEGLFDVPVELKPRSGTEVYP